MGKKSIHIFLILGMLSLYGGIDYFVLSRVGNKENKAELQKTLAQLQTFTQTVEKQLSQTPDYEMMSYLQKQAESPWKKDPFSLQMEDVPSVQPSKEPESKDLVYSGFIQLGNQRMAIINGMEYYRGDMLKEKGYTLVHISPTQVTLRDSDHKKHVLPLAED